jgi:hypothetical protein
MVHFVEEAALVVVVVGAKVDRLGPVVLLVEEQIYPLILVVLLQVVKVDCLAQVVFKEEPMPLISLIPLIPLVIPTVLLQVAGLWIILVLVLLVHMVHLALVLPVHVGQVI